MTTTFERDAVATTMMNHGRADYRRGVDYRESAGEWWRKGWIEEAQRRSKAEAAPHVAKAMLLIETMHALEAAQVTLQRCTIDPARMGKHQRDLMARNVPLVSDALLRITEHMNQPKRSVSSDAIGHRDPAA